MQRLEQNVNALLQCMEASSHVEDKVSTVELSKRFGTAGVLDVLRRD